MVFESHEEIIIICKLINVNDFKVTVFMSKRRMAMVMPWQHICLHKLQRLENDETKEAFFYALLLLQTFYHMEAMNFQ